MQTFDVLVFDQILGEGTEQVSRLAPRFPLMPQDKIVLFGYNPDSGWIDPGEQARLKSCAMHKFPVGKIRGRPRDAALETLARIRHGVDRLGLDPKWKCIVAKRKAGDFGE